MRILLVDDHQIFREGTAALLRDEDYCDSIGCAASIDEALEVLGISEFDLLITDLNLEFEDGRDLLRKASALYPGMKLMWLTMYSELSYVLETVSLGISAYVTKSSGLSEISRAVIDVSEGRIYFDHSIMKIIIEHLGGRESRQALDQPEPSNFSLLTRREKEIFRFLSAEMRIDEIAGRLFLSSKTIENHRSRIYKKLKINDRLSLIRYAKENGLKQ
jgi:DNA-binding NarL/FixJ family response regulator